ncbi:MAG: hypothetical protein ACE5FL_14185 [Myxococcota bacterium]
MRAVIGTLLGAAFLGAVVYATLGESQVSCEVCVDYLGANECRSSSGVDRETAVSGAVAAACAVMSGGVTDGIRCMSTPPRSVRCDD